jgi:hypothetical protein
MKQAEIIIEIDEVGNPTVEVVGATGPGCTKLTEALEKALGAKVKDTKKPEYNRREVKNVASNTR